MPKRHPDTPSVLRDVRKTRKLSQQQAADLIGVSRTLWAAWETQRRVISMGHLNQILKVFELDHAEIELLCNWANKPTTLQTIQKALGLDKKEVAVVRKILDQTKNKPLNAQHLAQIQQALELHPDEVKALLELLAANDKALAKAS